MNLIIFYYYVGAAMIWGWARNIMIAVDKLDALFDMIRGFAEPSTENTKEQYDAASKLIGEIKSLLGKGLE